MSGMQVIRSDGVHVTVPHAIEVAGPDDVEAFVASHRPPAAPEPGDIVDHAVRGRDGARVPLSAALVRRGTAAIADYVDAWEPAPVAAPAVPAVHAFDEEAQS